MYRVYDTEKKLWIKNNIYMSPNEDLFVSTKKMFSTELKPLQDVNRYVYHRDISLYDKEDVLVYEGDYLEAKVSEDKTVIGLVTYAHEMSSYIILCVDSNEFYTLGSEVTELIKVIGNVFDGYEQKQKDK